LPAHPLFVYGTLMQDAVLERLLHRPPASQAATLNHYRRFRLPGRSYPGIRYCRHHQVRGRLLAGLDRIQLRRLDRYEGAEYRRVRVQVTAGGRKFPAWAYVARRRA
jgi:gamma-glutamylcyclotransferase (GGCT)/AIG2-like uncharacterized protein YtfP